MIDIGKELQAAFDDGYSARDKEIVRCGEYKYAMHTSETGKVLGCKHFKWKSRGLRTENDYCSYGERKEQTDGEN